MATSSSNNGPPTDLPWIPPPPETSENRFWRKAKENPFVPIGRCGHDVVKVWLYLYTNLYGLLAGWDCTKIFEEISNQLSFSTIIL